VQTSTYVVEYYWPWVRRPLRTSPRAVHPSSSSDDDLVTSYLNVCPYIDIG